MEYLGKDIPKLGFGLMRLPLIGEEIDIEQTKQMVDLFLAKGFTYFDTAYGYFNGKSEEAVKTVLVDRYPRESFQLATKLPAWIASSEEEAKKMFETSLRRTGAGYFDFYLMHNISEKRKEAFDKYKIWDYLRELKEKGLVRHIGFSYHDKAALLDKILTELPDVEFVQLQINYADWESDSVESRKCYEVALKHNKPIIIMEPVKGGVLANPGPKINQIFKEANPEASLASWAIRFAASLDNVITVLSGMSNLEQMKDNISYMEHFQPLNDYEREVIRRAQEALKEIPSIPCTSCQYCVKDCPQQINIPFFFVAMNRNLIFGDLKGAKFEYKMAMKFGSEDPAKCIACGNCERVCPQQLKIIDHLKDAVQLLS
ncbi:MAG: 4Fe-4S dicluster domain-containing protein [Peptococcaceae bacterium]|nr:4Fe-4S dicluster domain-containing protein [Peptococcaceae bacterium]